MISFLLLSEVYYIMIDLITSKVTSGIIVSAIFLLLMILYRRYAKVVNEASLKYDLLFNCVAGAMTWKQLSGIAEKREKGSSLKVERYEHRLQQVNVIVVVDRKHSINPVIVNDVLDFFTFDLNTGFLSSFLFPNFSTSLKRELVIQLPTTEETAIPFSTLKRRLSNTFSVKAAEGCRPFCDFLLETGFCLEAGTSFYVDPETKEQLLAILEPLG